MTIKTGAGILFDFALFYRLNYNGNLTFFIHNDNKGRIVFGCDHAFMMLPRADVEPGLSLLNVNIPGDDMNIRPLVVNCDISESGQPLPFQLSFDKTVQWRDVFRTVWQNRPEIGEQVQLLEYCYKTTDGEWVRLPKNDREPANPAYILYHKRLQHKHENLIITGKCRFVTGTDTAPQFCHFNANLLDFFRMRGFNVFSNNRADYQPFVLSRDGKTFEGIIMPVKINDIPTGL